MIKNKYPLPLISDVVDKLAGAKYFTKIDIQWGFNNIRIREGDQWNDAAKTFTDHMRDIQRQARTAIDPALLFAPA